MRTGGISGGTKKWGQGDGDREMHANSPGKVSGETEVGTRRRLFGEPRIRSGSSRRVHNVCCQRDEAVGMGKGLRRDLSIG